MHKGTNTPCFRDTCIYYLEAAICRGVSKACYHWHLIFQFSLHQNNKILKQLTSAQRPKRWMISEGIGGMLTMEKVKFHGGQILKVWPIMSGKDSQTPEKKNVWMRSWNHKQTENIEMNRWREKNKDENFRNNSNVNTAFKNNTNTSHKK